MKNTQLETILQNEMDPAFAKRARIILEHIEKERPQKVLDAGCGRGFYSHAVSIFPFVKEIQGIDINSEYIKKAKAHCTDKRIHLQKASIYDLPFDNNYFDAIICSEILEHLDDDAGALKELKRVLKPGGILLISVPNYRFPFLWDPLNWLLMKVFNTHINKDIWWLAGIWADHVRLYKKEDLIKVIKATGWTIEDSHNIIRNCWPFSHFLLYGIGKNLVEKIGCKVGNRFDFSTKSSPSILAKLFRWPSTFDKDNPEVSMNIVMRLKK